MCGADSSLSFCKGYGDKAKKVAASVLKNKPADPESKQGAAATTPKAAGKSAAAGSSASLAVLAMGAAAVALVL